MPSPIPGGASMTMHLYMIDKMRKSDEKVKQEREREREKREREKKKREKRREKARAIVR